MIVVLALRFRRHIALFLYIVFYSQMLMAMDVHRSVAWHPDSPHFSSRNDLSAPFFDRPEAPFTGKDSVARPGKPHAAPQKRQTFIGGPSQPEMQSFSPVGANNMVDLFSGDFSYNIPLLDVGGYPVNISYHSGRSMDEDASWVGLGWNINPGSITRDMRGLPDDFNGGTDTIKKVSTIKPNISWGVSMGGNIELTGLPLLGLGYNTGIFHTTYNGWGLEAGLNASLNAGDKSLGPLSGGLSLSDNSQNGISITPSLSLTMTTNKASDNGGASFGLQLSAPYNSRTGIKDIQLGINSSVISKATATRKSQSFRLPSAGISFAWPTYTPDISIPTTNYNYTFTVKTGGELWSTHPSLFLSGYYGREYVAAGDSSLSLPAYGYLNFQNRSGAWSALTDFNREKELPYRESPAVPHIAVPSYTYDVFTMSGEGNGGMFRAYRGDIGFIADHLIANKTTTGAASIDLGAGGLVHGGTDLNANYSTTQTGPWLTENPLRNTVDFRKSNDFYESVYFRNPGEKTINTTDFYKAIGGDATVTAMLSQPGGGPSITASNYLGLYNGAQKLGLDTLNATNAVKNTRDKRSQVISYLSAAEASVSGLDKYINRYTVNQFGASCENDAAPSAAGKGTGLTGYYFRNIDLKGTPLPGDIVNDTAIYFDWHIQSPFNYHRLKVSNFSDPSFPRENWSTRWLGRLKAPATGTYTLGFFMDDGFRFWMNDTLLVDDWKNHHNQWDTVRVNLIAGKLYDIRAEYFQAKDDDYLQWGWRRPDMPNRSFASGGGGMDTIKKEFLFPPVFTDTIPVNPLLTREKRVNAFRKANHISEIDVLNPDGRKYVYGIPVYNLIQKESSFSVEKQQGDVQTGLTSYTGEQNSIHNNSGKNGYYSREEVPAYAHSFLLTGILSPDYVDVTGDGVSDDDLGDAVRFDYSKASGIANPFGWRAPYATGKATYNEGFRSYDRDDKAHYIYGTKELWYLHTIESKTMIATFTLQARSDLMEINEDGAKDSSGKPMCLKEINLYSKADFMAHGTTAIPIKTVHFEYSYDLCRGINQPVNDSGKLTLKKIWFTYNGNDKGALNPYVFNYHVNNPRYQLNQADKWGTYKDPAKNPGATASNPLPNAEYPYASQDSTLAANNAGAWSLDSIQLPSGGRIKVNYESDDYAYVQNRRATQMCRIAGVGIDSNGHYSNRLYNFLINDGLYIYVNVPYASSSNADLFARYLDGLGKLYFRLYVGMPKDDFGSGSEYVPCYADPDVAAGHWYGRVNDHTIWIKIKGVNTTGDKEGNNSPLAQTAINFLRLNLPSKAYPGSEVNDNLNITDGIKIMMSMITNVTGFLSGFTGTARSNGWASIIDTTSRSFVRLNNPFLKKLGGGSRVKSILIYDNWRKMTNSKQREAVYGQFYDYTTTQSVNGVMAKISSGVAAWEPSVGGEENPFHLPIEYVDRVSLLAPAALQYTEEPLGEFFFPGPSIGYGRVRTRSIHTVNTRSANGYSESTFYTSYDFPTSWDYTRLDPDTKKRYKPILNNLLRINSKNYLSLSQGFKVELNDMNGKLKTEATYAETDSVNPISYTANYYKVENQSVQFKHLNNTVATIDPKGNINPNASIGKDAELMTDMRDQTSTTTGANINVNVDLFMAGVWPLAIPSLLDLYQHETNQFRSVAMTKIIQRYGILDSVVHIDKGSKVSSKNLLYDAETGDPVLVRTQNEFNDSLFEFSYPSHWAYKGTGPAYQNIDVEFSHLTVDKGHIKGLKKPVSTWFTPGDELLVHSRQTITPNCDSLKVVAESFPDSYKLWVIDSIPVNTGSPVPYLVDQYGAPFSGNDVTLKIIRSGYRNQGGTIGSVTSMCNPLMTDGQGAYHLVLDSTRRVITAGANELQQLWRVSDKRRSNILSSCIYTQQDSALAAAENCSCLKPFFDYLIANRKLYPSFLSPWTTVGSIAAAAGIDLNSCPILKNNAQGRFRVMTPDPNGSIFMAMIGNDAFDIRSLSGRPLNLYAMTSSCDAQGRVLYKTPGLVIPPPDTVTLNINPVSFVNLISSIGTSCPSYVDSLTQQDSLSDRLLVENSLTIDGAERNATSILNFGRLDKILPWDSILSAKLLLYADHRGHLSPQYPNANSTNTPDSVGISLSSPAGWFPHQPLDTMLYQAYYTPWFRGVSNAAPFQDVSLDATDYVNGFIYGNFPSSTFILTQGAGGMHGQGFDSNMIVNNAVPPYLSSGVGNYYSTYYSQRYADASKRPVLQVKYLAGHGGDTSGAILEFNSSLSCTTVFGRSCYSAITDTLVNPYQYGILGNYRPTRSYVYYGRRKESDPAQQVDIRTAGVIGNFAPFWTLQDSNWVPSYDTTRWVWNGQTTLFNRKGFELENKDPLGRYNSGLYGYGLTLPTAVTQNSRYQESAFDGFEDYGFKPNSCDTTCAEARPFDFSAYESNISDSVAHSGLYSLRIEKGNSISLVGLNVAGAPDPEVPGLSDTLGAGSCGSGPRFAGIKASATTVLPSFKPFAGKKMLIGAWVKEEDSCSCQTYANNHILVGFTGGSNTSVTLLPSGNMIEGWQRYEGIVTIPSNATSMSVTLQASASSVTYFDDIRLHPFNAEMKSYVYNPVNLRLMAELDENNYATFYEYDDDGTLIRVKKETEKGIMTIKETRSALLKDQ